MKNQSTRLEWFEYKWRWVLLAMVVALVASIAVRAILSMFHLVALPRAAGLASMFASFATVTSYSGERERLRPALKQGVYLFCIWTPFMVIADWATSGIRDFSFGGSPS